MNKTTFVICVALVASGPMAWAGPSSAQRARPAAKYSAWKAPGAEQVLYRTPYMGKALLKGFPETVTETREVKRWDFIRDELRSRTTGRVVRDMSRSGEVWGTETTTRDVTKSKVARFRHAVVKVAPNVVKVKLAEHLASTKDWRGGMWESHTSREPHRQVDVERPLAAQAVQVKLSGPVRSAKLRAGGKGQLFLDAVVTRANGRLAGEVYPLTLGPGDWGTRDVSIGKRIRKSVPVDAKTFRVD